MLGSLGQKKGLNIMNNICKNELTISGSARTIKEAREAGLAGRLVSYLKSSRRAGAEESATAGEGEVNIISFNDSGDSLTLYFYSEEEPPLSAIKEFCRNNIDISADFYFYKPDREGTGGTGGIANNGNIFWEATNIMEFAVNDSDDPNFRQLDEKFQISESASADNKSNSS